MKNICRRALLLAKQKTEHCTGVMDSVVRERFVAQMSIPASGHAPIDNMSSVTYDDVR